MYKSDLPAGWVLTNIGTICTKVTDGSHNPPKASVKGLPMLSAKNIHSRSIDFDLEHRLIPLEDFETEDKRTDIQENDVLLTIVGALGRTAVVPVGMPKFTLQRSVAVLSAPCLSASFLRYALEEQNFQTQILENAKGTAQKGIYLKKLKELILLLPPMAEQKVIAEKLDTLLAQVDNTKARLERIPEILKRFRQSVLAAAVSGKLTEEWRESRGFIWQTLTIGDLAEVKGGKRLPKGDELIESNTGFPYIRAGQLKDGTVINTNDARSKQLYLKPETQQLIKRYTVAAGDLYITIVGASIGDAGVIPSHCDGANLTENAAKLTEFKRPLVSDFLSYWLRSQQLQDLIKLEIKSGAQGKLALMRIKELPAPYTDVSEQSEIVRRVEELLAFADRIEHAAQAALSRVNNLTQSILAKAFRGELTADWRAVNPELISGENSAEALLAKIKTERAKLSQTKKGRGKSVEN